MIFINNKKQILFTVKLKDSTGSAMPLVIVVMALLLIFAPYVTNQISNQFKSTRNSYENIQEKYLAEAGIERIISDIEKQVKVNATKSNIVEYSNTNHHSNDNCPKVTFNDEGKIDWGIQGVYSGNNFFNLIHYQIILRKSDVHYNLILNENWKVIFGKDSETRPYYEDNIRRLIENMTQNKDMSQLNILETNINYFINMMEDAKEKVNISNGTIKQKKQAVDGYNQMIEYMKEIKCRLSMNTSDGGESKETKQIEIPYYDVTVDENKINTKPNNTKSKRCKITIIRENGKVTSIDFSKLNNTLIGAKSYDYEISADVDFIFNPQDYSIEQNINSFKRVN